MKCAINNALKKQIKKCKSANEGLDENLIKLIKLINENQGTGDTLSAEALHDARNVIHYSNLLGTEVSELIRSQHDTEFDGDMDIITHDPIYRVATTCDGVFVRVPMAPYSVQRSAQRKSDPAAQSFSRRRYAEVDALLRCTEPVTLYGKKVLYILHAYDKESKYRASPDYDNYDVKDLIDVATAHYGGDNPCNIIAIHDVVYSRSLMPATYLSIHDLDRTCQLEDLLGEMEQIFCKM